MDRKRYTLHCPYCHAEYGLFETDEELQNDYLLGKQLNVGVSCSVCGENIVFIPSNLYPTQPQ